ncbi:MAG: growth inhibitor PemK [Treponema sp. GWB1_62_6]|nr:MAG: growth inhibitor PemK [Treponema sp. GWA1_62_8]OHE63073.1 MAG: growth inhibitor PemK [Treponema sp. GWC1_61_84]OHE70319.1 MAG: growth inhibitor PemK [Treponema sp. GWB1_62_6]OHE76783.1 MAG: growth inhibitor PemK [Treponema sp. RIFOXYC1_FULL_61_9]HCM26856.1 growth inhibitor PemK [Treponema sp.]
MPDFRAWDIIKIPFPYTNRPVRERRPALVVAADGVLKLQGLLWVLMITSSENRPWSGDVAVSDLGMAGLPAPSVVRTAKIATIETKESERIGDLPDADRIAVSRYIQETMAGVVHDQPREQIRIQQDPHQA